MDQQLSQLRQQLQDQKVQAEQQLKTIQDNGVIIQKQLEQKLKTKDQQLQQLMDKMEYLVDENQQLKKQLRELDDIE